MRVLLVAALASIAGAGASLPAAAGASDHLRETMVRERASSMSDDGMRTQRRRIARATTSDVDDDDYEARPRQRTYQRDEARPRYTKRHAKRHTARRHAKNAKRSRRHVARRSGQSARHAARPTARRAAAAPGWTRRSLAGSGPKGSGQHGVASFYWQPQRVASGGWFNPNAMTAAHRSLPFGTRVRVTHLGNGRSVEVRINDRGPYIAGRIIDLSRAAAGVIGMTGQGIARVGLTILGR
jgi:rare lipoprotein A